MHDPSPIFGRSQIYVSGLRNYMYLSSKRFHRSGLTVFSARVGLGLASLITFT
jgi:hypothetical protein